MISDCLLDLVRILTLSTEERFERLPDRYTYTKDTYVATGTMFTYGQWRYEQIIATDYSDCQAVQKALITVQELPSRRLQPYVGAVDDNR